MLQGHRREFRRDPYRAGLPQRRHDRAVSGRAGLPRSSEGMYDPCPCGSGKKIRKCHRRLVWALRNRIDPALARNDLWLLRQSLRPAVLRPLTGAQRCINRDRHATTYLAKGVPGMR